MSYSGFRFTGRFAVQTRPADRVPAVEGNTWAKDKVGGVGGTEVDATFLNRLKANLENLVERVGGTLNDGDEQLANALEGALLSKSDADHDHDGRYYTESETDALLASRQATAQKGEANGYAGLDETGKIPTSLIPAALLGFVAYQETWDANANDPPLASGVGTKGHFYVVDTPGDTDIDGVDEWKVGDWALFNGTVWEKVDNTDAVSSVAGLMGAISGSALKTALAIAAADITDASANGRSLLSAANYGAMRTLLGLDSAATADVGTGPHNILRLDGDGRLPAVDGSLVTGVLATDGLPKGILNRIINGGFDIWQRGTGPTDCPSGTPTFLADRWAVVAAGATMTQQRSTSLPPDARSRYSLHITGATSGTTCNARQRIEAADIPALKRTVVITAKIRNDTGGALTPVLLFGTPSAADNFGSVTNRLTQDLQSCADGAWTTVSHSVDISGYTNIDNGLQVDIQFPSGSLNGSGKSVKIAEVSLTEGAAVPIFAPIPWDIEERRCLRFFERLASNGEPMNGSPYNADAAFNTWSFKVRKRAVPTIVGYGSGISPQQFALDFVGGYAVASSYPTWGSGSTANAEL